MEGFESLWKGLATNKVAHQSDKSASFSLRQCFFFLFSGTEAGGRRICTKERLHNIGVLRECFLVYSLLS